MGSFFKEYLEIYLCNILNVQGAEYHLTTYYLAILLGLLVIACLNSGLLANQSAKGRKFEPTTSTNPHPRRLVEPLLYVNIILTFVEFIWTAIGTYFTINDFIKCIDQVHERTVIIGVVFNILLR